MQIQIETPPIASGSAASQLQSLRSYLHRTAQQLQWAFETLEEKSLRQETAVQAAKPQKVSPGETFGAIKDLIIKSADIVEAYETNIRKTLDGEYAAKSEFGSFRQQTSAQLEADSQRFTQLFSNTQELTRLLDTMQKDTAATRAYLRTGLLKDGDPPTYGLEIGQRNEVNGQQIFRKFARFTADRLSFFDSSDVEVAYISDFKLCITSAQVAGTLQLGSRFQMEIDNGLIFKWKGGEA